MRIFYKTKFSLNDLELKDFDTARFICKGIYASYKNIPVVILKDMNKPYMPYRVVNRLFCRLFKTFNEADVYCTLKFKRIKGGIDYAKN